MTDGRKDKTGPEEVCGSRYSTRKDLSVGLRSSLLRSPWAPLLMLVDSQSLAKLRLDSLSFFTLGN